MNIKTVDDYEQEYDRIIRDAMAQGWDEGHEAGRDYQGDGWNSDAHDWRRDNPYREEA